MSFQTWICPKCYDDHRRDGPCSPMGVDKFSPPPEDQSYIAIEFRKLESKLAWAESLLKRAKSAMTSQAIDAKMQWLADLEKGFEGEK